MPSDHIKPVYEVVAGKNKILKIHDCEPGFNNDPFMTPQWPLNDPQITPELLLWSNDGTIDPLKYPYWSLITPNLSL